MRKLYLPFIFLFVVTQVSLGQVKITGVMDGPLSGGLPKVVELQVTQNSTDLSGWSLSNYNNGQSSITNTTSLSGTYNTGDYLYVIYQGTSTNDGVASFKSFFERTDAQYALLNTFVGPAPNVNGNDAIAISNGTTNIDVFGEIGVDGTGKAWEYLDGWAYGANTTTGSFVAEDWTYSGINALDGETTNSGAASPFPSPNPALPVELTSFTATAMTKGVMLNWSTATEVNNYGFDIERASTPLGTSWEKIGFVEGHGNSNSPNDYSFLDNSLVVGDVSYRLKQIDTDGKFEYSDVVTVTSTKLAKYELFQNHPNPFNPSTVVSFSLPDISHVKLTVYNAIGQEVAKLVDKEMEAGYHNINFDGSNLATGFYFYRLETANYSKTMKMMLIK